MAQGERPSVLIVTGMSGAGRSTAAKVLEDLRFTVIDNLPPALISAVAAHHRVPETGFRIAVVVDSRGGLPTEAIRQAIDQLEQQGIRTMVLFLDAEDQVLIKRYEENRRPHPIEGGTLAEAIAAERTLLSELRTLSDEVIDTTELNVHQLRDRISDRFREGSPDREIRLSVTSFGYKHGLPRDADLVFDVRFLHNPHWVPELRALRGTDRAVADYVFANPDATSFFGQMRDMISFLVPRFRAEGKSYVSVAIGCTGGHHRSVAMAERLASELEGGDIEVVVRHRDIDR